MADKFGNMFVVGDTASTDLPTRNALQPMHAGGSVPNVGSDIFLAKFAPDGSLLFSTYFGGIGGEGAHTLVLDEAGNPIIVANTTSTDFPLRNPVQSTLAGSPDTAVVKFLADGSDFVFSTYIGGPGGDLAQDMAIDADGNLYVTGQADPGFPTKNAFQPTAAGGGIDAFVYELNAEGTAIVYSTYLGGTGTHELGYAIAVDELGAAYVAGLTNSSDFPTRNAFQNIYRGGGQFGDDAFVAKIAPNGANLVYSSFLGGSNGDRALAIAVDRQGSAYVTGHTLSTNFPTKNAFQSTFGGGTSNGDAFVTKVGTAGDSLVYSTYAGDSAENASVSIQVDSAGSAFFATTGDMRNRANVGTLYFDYGSVSDPYIGQLAPNGQQLVRGIYLGGNSFDSIEALHVNLGQPGVVYFAGRTTSTNFSTANAFQTHLAGNVDGVFGKLILETPAIAITSPADGVKVAAGTTVLVTGAASGHVLVHGTPVDAFDAAGNFYEQVVIAPGQNTFSFSTTDRFSQTATATLMLTGAEPTAGQVDFSLFSDVSASFAPDYARTSFNEQERILYADWAIRNSGQYPTDVPLFVGVTNISDPRVRVHEPVGLTPDGIPYFDFTPLVPGGRLSPNQTTGTTSLSFFNPERIQFTYDLVFFGMLNRAPAITSIPDVEALADRPYEYNVDATDPDDDPVTYSLVAGPTTSVIDSTTGLITWQPTSGELGTHAVTVRVEDGRGGSTEQRYFLSVIQPPPNRPPVFTSVPVVSADVNSPYAYDADAVDPDGDILSYSLTVKPAGMSIDGANGHVAWIPNANQVGTHVVTLVVDDGHGGQSVQQYTASVEQEEGNHRPIIITDPVTTTVVGVPYTYDVDAIDPDKDSLAYSLTEAPTGMTIDSNSGLISWMPNGANGSPGISFGLGGPGSELGGGTGTGITVDVDGNFYMSGHFFGSVDFDPGPGTFTLTSNSNTDVYVAKYNSHGGFIWASAVHGTSRDRSFDVEADSLGNVYIAGDFDGTTDFDPGPGVRQIVSAGDTDAYVLKLSRDGDLVWVRSLGGVGQDSVENDIELDINGDVYLAGEFSEIVDFDPGPGAYLLASAGSVDAFIWKLDSDGNLIWARRSGGSSPDNSYGVSVDPNGNVLINGYFNDGADQAVDFDPGPGVFNLSGYAQGFVWKLDSSGNFIWAREIGGEGRDAIALSSVDAAGNVYVTGGFRSVVDFDPGPAIFMLTSAGESDIFVLKLDSAGNFVWARRFGGSQSDSTGGLGTVVDPQGNVYFGLSFDRDATYGPGSDAFSVASHGAFDVVLLKLTSDGTLLWHREIGGAGRDSVFHLALDGCGNVHLTGEFNHTVDLDPGPGTYNVTNNTAGIYIATFSPNGDFVLNQDLCDTPVTVRVADGRGGFDSQSFNINLLGNRPPEIVSEPVTEAFAGHPYTYDVDAIDPDNDSLTYSLPQSPAGMAINSTTGVVSWTPDDLATEPTVPFRLGSTGIDSGLGTAIDAEGNLYLSGSFSDTVDFDPGPGAQTLMSLMGQDIFVAKYGRSGNLLWARSASGTGVLDRGLTVSVDGEGNVYVTGDFFGTTDFDPGPGVQLRTAGGAVDAFVWKLDSAGAFVWVRTVSSTGQDSSPFSPIKFDRAGNLYFAGEFSNTVDFDPGPGTYPLTSAGGLDIFVWKLDTQGNLIWARRIGGSSHDSAGELTLDKDGNLLVGGYFNDGGSFNTGSFDQLVDFDPGPGVFNLKGSGFIWKLDSAGNFVWARAFGGADGGGTTAGPTTDSEGNVYAFGMFVGTVDFDPGPSTFTLTSAGSTDNLIWKLDSAGNFVWAKRFGGSNNDGSGAIGTVVDSEGNLYIELSFQETANFSPGPGSFSLVSHGSYDAVLVKLAGNGDILWANHIGGPGGIGPRLIALDKCGNVHATGGFGDTVDFDPGLATFNLTSAGGSDIYHVAFTPSGDFLLRRGCVTVRVDDGRGGFDTQSFTIDVSTTSPGEIRGTKFNDINGNGIWETGELLASNHGNVAGFGRPSPGPNTSSIARYNAFTGEFLDYFVPPNSGGLIQPHGVEFGPDGNLYVTDHSANVLRYDGQTGDFLDVFTHGDGGEDIAFGPDGTVFVSGLIQSVSRIARFDGTTGNFINVIASGGMLQDAIALTIGPDGNLYATSAGADSVLRFNGLTGSFIDVFVPPGDGGLDRPAHLAFGPDGNLYVASLFTNSILRYDGVTGAFLGIFVAPGSGGLGTTKDSLAFGPDGNLYTHFSGHPNSQFDGVLRFDGRTGDFIDVFVPPGSGQLSSPQYLVFTSYGEGGIADWIMYIDGNLNGQRDVGERFTTTDRFGNYSFPNLAPGTYVVAEEHQEGWVQTAPADQIHTVTVAAGQTVIGFDFGNQQTNEPQPNREPTFATIPPATSTVGQLLKYDAVAFDADNDPLSFDLVVKPAGMAVDPPTGIVVWVPTADQVGEHDVTLRVQDGRGGVDLQSFRITVTRPNSAPVITSIPKGPAVVAVKYEYQVTAQDADGDTLAFQLDAKPDGMTIDVTTGLVRWTPAANQVGTQYVAVTAIDGRGASTTQSFDLPVVASAPNDPPTISSTPRGTVRISDQYLYQVVASDPNGDPLTFFLPTAPAGLTIDAAGLVKWQPIASQLGANQVQVRVADGRGAAVTQSFTVNVVTQATNRPPSIVSTPPQAATVARLYAYDVRATDPDGDPLSFGLDVSPAGMSIDPGLGTIRWTPAADQLGAQSVVVRVFDSQGGSASQSFSIQVRAVNLPPGISSTPPTTAVVNSPYSYGVRASDPDGDPLTFALTQAPTGMTVDASSGLIQWTPTATQVGSQNVALRVSDGQGGTVTQNFTVVVSSAAVNLPPVITSTPSTSATASQPYTYTVTAVDPEGASLLFSLLQAPTGMSINPTSGLVQWTPGVTQLGGHTVTIAAIDPAGNGGTQSFTLAVTDSNRAPTITSAPVQVVMAGLPYRYDVRATDPDGDRISFQLDTAPAGMTIDQLGRITWSTGIPNVGTHRIAVTVEDPRGLFQTQTYDLAVQADRQTPRVNLLVSSNPAELGSFVTFVVTATDNVGVASLGLTINGNSVPLDASGRVTLEARPIGTYQLVASASDAAGNTGLASTSLLVRDTSDIDPPDVAMTSPLDNAVITAPIDVVGTAADSNLLFYTLSAAPMGSATFRELFRGTTSVTNGVLGKFDPSGLANDTYTLRLSATDAGGNEAYVDTVVEVAGDLKVGNFTLSFTDLTVPVSGIPITVSRTYDTLQSGRQDELGYGWRLEFRDTDLRTSVAPSGNEEYGYFTPYNLGARVYVTAPGGRREGFTFRPRPKSGFGGLLFSEPEFVPDAGVTSRLSVPPATLIIGSDGLYYGANALAYNPADELNWGGVFFLTTKDGIAYEIDANTGDLMTLADSNSNTLTFTDTSITSNRGQKITFERDPQGRITAAVDPAGQKVRYKYDGRGDLVEVTDREGNVTKFIYGSPSQPHFLTEIIDPLGRTGVRTEYDAQGRLIKLIDAAGNPVQLIHDPDNAIETIKDAQGNSTTFEYDTRGNVVTEVNAIGGITRRTYDGATNMLTETDSLGNVTAFSYDGDGNVLTETDPLGNVTRFTYTTVTPGFFDRVKGARPASLLTTTTDPLGNTTTNSYSGTNLVSTRDAAGKLTSFTYDSAGNQTSITDATGNVTTFEYAGANLTRQVDALGHASTYTYDSNGNQLTQTTTQTVCGTAPHPACPPGGPAVITRQLVTSTTYDANGRPVSVRDAEGHTTRTDYDQLGNEVATIDAVGRRTEFTYDDRGQLVSLKYPDGSTTATEYDELGRRISSTDRAGRVTRFAYDALGRLTTTISPDGTPADNTDNPRARSEYDQAGRVTAQIDELGHRTEFVYDAAGRQTVVRDALGHETTTSYDDAGRSLAVTDALGRATQFVYDTLGRQVQTKLPDGAVTSTAYDALGRSVAQTDQAGRVTMFEYDRLGRLTAVVDALNQRTEYAYDEAGNLIMQQDANSHVTRYEYDGLGRRTAHVLPMGQRSTTVYDAVGNVASTKDFNGDTIQFSYDVSNRLLKKTFPDSTSVAFTYTVNGQRSTYTDERGVTTWAYDERDRLITRTDPDGAKIAYSYDAVGNRISTTTTVPTNPPRTTAYTFDELNRSKTVTDPEGGQTRYFYDAVSRLIRTELPNNTAEKREYDALNRLQFLENRNVATDTVISSYRYTLDPTGNRTSVVEHDGRRVAYDYDALYRLISEDIFNAGSATLSRSIDYTYDAVGNRLTRTDTTDGLSTYSYDNNDRLSQETTAGVATTYTYDNNGNTLSKISATDRVFYDWDFENRLTSADTDGNGTPDVSYRYDADGIRVSSTSAGQETRYLIDPVHPFPQVVEEYTPGGVIKLSYVHGLDLISQNRPASTGESFYHVDGLGSTRALTNSSGLVTDRYLYDAFGRTIGQVGTTGNVYLFAGEQRDLATGLDYLRARYYAPSGGRFYGMDPFEGLQEQPMSLHRFLYANANPVMNIDPSGEFTLVELVITTAIQGILRSPEVVFGSVKIVATKILASALDPAFRAKEKALRQIADGVNADLAIENYLTAQEVIALGFRVYHAGLGAIDDADAFAGIALSLGGVADAFLTRSPQITANVQPLVDAIRDVRSTLTGPRLPGITPGYLEAVFGSIDLARSASDQLRRSLRSQGSVELVQSIIDAAQTFDGYLGVTQHIVSKLMGR